MISLVETLRRAGCVFAEDEARVLNAAASDADELATFVARRVSGEPLEYVVGWAEFAGRRIAVDSGVFVPRRRTEFLVDQAVDLLARRHAGVATVVDLCCGCAAIGVAIAAAAHDGRVAADVRLIAADLDPAAVRCAARNVAAVGRAHRAYQGDLYDALPADLRGRVDMLVVNAPYVPTDAIDLMPREARLYEPTIALDGGTDGLAVQRRVAKGAPDWLAAGGHLLIETGADQAAGTAALMADAGLTPAVTSSPELEYDATVVVGRV